MAIESCIQPTKKAKIEDEGQRDDENEAKLHSNLEPKLLEAGKDESQSEKGEDRSDYEAVGSAGRRLQQQAVLDAQRVKRELSSVWRVICRPISDYCAKKLQGAIKR